MRVFTNRNDSSTDPAHEPDSGRGEAESRFAEGFELLFGEPFQKLGDQIDRIQFFSDQAADALVQEGVEFRIRDLVLRPPARFARSYLLRRGFRDGMAGFIIAVASAFYVFLKYAKHWERSRVSGERDRRG